MSTPQSALYVGSVMHRRLRPRQHRLRYGIFYLLIDLDEIDALAARLHLFSHNRFNFFSIHDSDFGDGGAASPRDKIHGYLSDAGIEAGGAIRLLTMPRILGFAFNPVSIYFCHRRDDSLAAILYEVNNTFGQRHSYLIPVAAEANGRRIRQESRKAFFVSPFMAIDMVYSFSVVPPGDDLEVSIVGRDRDGPMLIAGLSAARRELTDASLARVFCVYPFLTLKVIVGIYWEALLLWRKGVGLHHRPPAPARVVTISRENDSHAAASTHVTQNVGQ